MIKFQVLIEWKGRQPSSTFYRRLRELVPKGCDPDQAAVIQEGVIVTMSESLARVIACIAADEGAAGVIVSRVVLDEPFVRTHQDEAILRRIEATMGKRGKRPLAQDWVISCTECGRASTVHHHAPISCPHCGGLLVHIRPGQPRRFRDPGGDIFDVWLCTRFAGPHWEPAELDPASSTLPPAEVEVLTDRERVAADLLAASPVLSKIRTMPREVAFAFLDAIFLGRAYKSKETRLAARIDPGPAGAAAFRLNEPARPDLMDATAVLGADMVVSWLLQPGPN